MNRTTRPPALLVLEDGMAFDGRSFGKTGEVCAEVVFNTAMTGYQEILTDPSYRGQMVCMTYPLIGNYGVNEEDIESGAERPWVEGFIIRELSSIVSNWRATQGLSDYLARNNLLGIDGIDTRALVLHLREFGSLRGCLSTVDLDPESLMKKALAHPKIDGRNLTEEVTRREISEFPPAPTEETSGLKAHHVVAIDYGMKENIRRLLQAENFRVTIVPATATAGEILALKPDGVFLSNGPGDPSAVRGGIETARGWRWMGAFPRSASVLGTRFSASPSGGKRIN